MESSTGDREGALEDTSDNSACWKHLFDAASNGGFLRTVVAIGVEAFFLVAVFLDVGTANVSLSFRGERTVAWRSLSALQGRMEM